MKMLLATVLLTVAGTASATTRTTEGRLDTDAITLDDERQASYSENRGEHEASFAQGEREFGKNKQAATVASADRIAYRDKTVALSDRVSWFQIFDAGSTLRRDRDGDGYHSEFQIRIDADVQFGDALVYAKLYIRRVGSNDDWRLYHVTDDFWIHGQSGNDDYFVTTTLDDGFPTAEYDVLVDLYESGYNGIVATLSAYDDVSLAYLPLEESGLDVAFGLPGFSIQNVATTLLIDDDRDGYYSRFRISFDPDVDFGPVYVYADIWVRPRGGDWIREHTSADFIVDASGTADTYAITADWISGYPTAEYDVQIDLYDSQTDLLVASAGSERAALSQLPLEDQSRDGYVNSPPTGGGGGTTTSHEHGGGAISWWLGLALVALLLNRRTRHPTPPGSKHPRPDALDARTIRRVAPNR